MLTIKNLSDEEQYIPVQVGGQVRHDYLDPGASMEIEDHELHPVVTKKSQRGLLSVEEKKEVIETETGVVEVTEVSTVVTPLIPATGEPPAEESNKCLECGREFKTEGGLDRHLKNHEKPESDADQGDES